MSRAGWPSTSSSFRLGLAYVVGNIIEQGAGIQNPALIPFGAVGWALYLSALYPVDNTLMDERPVNGLFLVVRTGARALFVFNNLLVGNGRLETAGPGDYWNNASAVTTDFIAAERFDMCVSPSHGYWQLSRFQNLKTGSNSPQMGVQASARCERGAARSTPCGSHSVGRTTKLNNGKRGKWRPSAFIA